MGYQINNTTLRIINRIDGKVYKPFNADLYVDPCRLPNKRFTVYTNNRNHATDYSWYEIITSEDTAHIRYVKWAYIRDLIALEQSVIDAKNNLVKFTSNGRNIDI